MITSAITVYRIKLSDGTFATRGSYNGQPHGSIFTTLSAARGKRTTELGQVSRALMYADKYGDTLPAHYQKSYDNWKGAEIIEYQLVPTGCVL